MAKNKTDYMVHFEDIDLESCVVFEFVDNNFESKKEVSFESCAHLMRQDASLFIFLPSTQILSFEFKRLEDEDDVEFRNRFYDEKGETLICDFSRYFFMEDKDLNSVYLFDKKLLGICKKLSQQHFGKLFVYPENYLLKYESSRNVFYIFDRGSLYLKTGYLTGFLKYQQPFFLKKFKESFPDIALKPSIFGNTEEANDEATLIDLQQGFLENFKFELPTFFRKTIDLDFFKSYFLINKQKMFVGIVLVLLFFLVPKLNMFVLDYYKQKYRVETLTLLKTLDPKINQLINVKAQFNAMVKESNQNELQFEGDALSVLRQVDKVSGYFQAIEVNLKKKIVYIKLKEIPDLKLNMLIGVLEKQGLLKRMKISGSSEKEMYFEMRGNNG